MAIKSMLKTKDSEIADDLKAISKAEKDFKAGKVISFRKIVKKLGLEKEVFGKKP